MEDVAGVGRQGNLFGLVWNGLRRIEFGKKSTHFEVKSLNLIVGSLVTAQVIIPVDIPSDRSVKLPFILYKRDGVSISDALWIEAEKINALSLSIDIIQNEPSGIISKISKVIQVELPYELKSNQKCNIYVTSDLNLMKAVIQREEPSQPLGGGGKKRSESSLNLKKISAKKLVNQLGIITDKVLKYETRRQKALFEFDEKTAKEVALRELRYCREGVRFANELLKRTIDLTEDQKKQGLEAINDFNRLEAEIQRCL